MASCIGLKEIICALCTDYVSKGENAKTLNCSHVFHNICIGERVLNNPTCPICLSCIGAKSAVESDSPFQSVRYESQELRGVRKIHSYENTFIGNQAGNIGALMGRIISSKIK